MFYVSSASTALQSAFNSNWYERPDPIHNSKDETKMWESAHRNHVDPI